MGAAPRGLIYVACAILIAIAAAVDAADVASVVVGLAKCADCGSKNLKAEDAFKGLQVNIKCKNADNGEYESKAVGELDSTGAFSIPLDMTDLHSSDCFAQLHSEENTPCPGQAPSKIMPLSKGDHGDGVHGKNTFVAVAGKTHYSSSTACTSAFLCDPIKDFFDFFHKKKLDAPEPKPKPEPKAEPSPEYGSAPPSPSTPIYH